MVKAYIVATPSGRSVISIRNDPRKALSRTKTEANKERVRLQKYFKVKLRVKQISVPKNQFF